MDFYRHLFTIDRPGKELTFALVYLVSIIFTFQTLVTAYSASAYLEQFIDKKFVGLIFALAAFGAIVINLTLPRLLRRVGNVKTVLIIMTLLIISSLVTGSAINPTLTVLAFIAYNAIYPQIYFSIDIFMETLIGDSEESTGSHRGLVLGIMSLAAFLSPVAMGYIIGDDSNLSHVYYVSAAVGLLFIAVIIAKFRQFYDPVYETIRVRDMVASAFVNKNISTVMFTQFLLQFFFTWAVIYIPLYLFDTLNFTWPEISQIIAAGLFAYVIFEYPVGLLADKKFGEKEMMATGFMIMALTSAATFYITSSVVTTWMIIMFVSRIGASMVEVTTESYFFKQVKGHDSNMISLFRLMRPLGNLMGALAGSLALMFMPLSFIFLILAFFMVSGMFITLRIKDTR
jgi:MFS family permease